ncbi:MAG: hypothetical protein WAN48_01915 [Actinomycetes bacterium]
MAEAELDRVEGADEVASVMRPAWWWFFAWLVVGTLASIAVLGALTIGVFVVPVAVVTAVIVATRRGALAGWPGLISGLGVPLLWVAYLNRSGPGTVCTTTPTSASCVDEWSPWPWLVVGLLLISGGAVVFAEVRRGSTGRRVVDHSDASQA